MNLLFIITSSADHVIHIIARSADDVKRFLRNFKRIFLNAYSTA